MGSYYEMHVRFYLVPPFSQLGLPEVTLLPRHLHPIYFCAYGQDVMAANTDLQRTPGSA